MKFRTLLASLVVLSAVGAGAQDRIYDVGNGVFPVVVKQISPEYTPEAKAAKIQGNVMVQAVVLSDGTVGEVTVINSLDAKLGLDQQALAAAKQWLFKPATKDGKPVAVRVRIELTFKLK